MKNITFIILAILILACGWLFFLFFTNPNYNELNFVQKIIAERINNKWVDELESMPKDQRAIVDYDSLMNELNFFERNYAERIFSINPQELGFKGPFYSKDKPIGLVKIKSIKLGAGKNSRETGIQFCPAHSYNDYIKMMEQMNIDIGKRLFIDSGYRSPGRQAYLFFHYLVTSSQYSLLENAKWIAMPGYSEHGSPINNAIDFTSSNGINGFSDNQTASDFESLDEYDWMLKNANKFNFYLSYPRDNIYGVEFEPWHWHWGKAE